MHKKREALFLARLLVLVIVVVLHMLVLYSNLLVSNVYASPDVERLTIVDGRVGGGGSTEIKDIFEHNTVDDAWASRSQPDNPPNSYANDAWIGLKTSSPTGSGVIINVTVTVRHKEASFDGLFEVRMVKYSNPLTIYTSNLSNPYDPSWTNTIVTFGNVNWTWSMLSDLEVRITPNSLVDPSWIQIDYVDVIITYGDLPIADFTYSPTNPFVNQTVTFNASTSTPNGGTIVSYEWDFGDATQGSGMIVAHNYTATGPFTVTLNVTDSEGLWDIESQIVTIAGPVASFTYSPLTPFTDETVVFNASLSTPYNGTIVSYYWNFGDGTEITELDPIAYHNYTTTGTFDVTLNVTDNDGLWDIETKSITVIKYPTAYFTFSPENPLVGETITFDASLSTPNGGTINDYQWDFGDGTNETGVIVNHAYTAEGNYTVSLTITDSEGLSDTENKSIIIASPPFDWAAILTYILPIIIGAIFFLVAGIMWKKRGPTVAGFEFFDEITGGGIPNRYATMIIGGANSGKSVLCQQLVHTYLSKEKPCIYVAYDSFPDEVRKNMKNFNWDTSTHEKMGTFRFVDCYSSMAGVTSKEENFVEQPFSFSDLGIAMSVLMDQLKRKSPKIFLDSTISLFTRLDPSIVVEFLQDRSARVKGRNGGFFFTVSDGTVPSDVLSKLEGFVDCTIQLYIREVKGKTMRRLRIKKLRGRRFVDSWITFEIKPKRGLVLFPPKGWSKSTK